jgi:hypothetical protein
MNAHSLLFRTDRFNLSKTDETFINPCCFGEDLARWLREALRKKTFEVSEPYQEDWGWELPAKNGGEGYYLCVSGNADDEGANSNAGEWRIIIEKRRSIGQRLTGQGKIELSDRMLISVREILESEPDIRDVHMEP